MEFRLFPNQSEKDNNYSISVKDNNYSISVKDNNYSILFYVMNSSNWEVYELICIENSILVSFMNSPKPLVVFKVFVQNKLRLFCLLWLAFKFNLQANFWNFFQAMDHVLNVYLCMNKSKYSEVWIKQGWWILLRSKVALSLEFQTRDPRPF